MGIAVCHYKPFCFYFPLVQYVFVKVMVYLNLGSWPQYHYQACATFHRGLKGDFTKWLVTSITFVPLLYWCVFQVGHCFMSQGL